MSECWICISYAARSKITNSLAILTSSNDNMSTSVGLPGCKKSKLFLE